jgi:uncharacterized membrane protein
MPSARRQGLVALAGGVVVGVVVGFLVRPAVAPLAGYDAAALFYLARVWWRIWPLDADATAGHAAREDPTRATADIVLLAAAIASLGAVAVVIVKSHSSHGSVQGLEIGMGAGSVVVSWLVVHTIFTLKYARLYYGSSRRTDEGGVDFEHKVRPPYSDFAYLAFTIGMTFQVSDTDIHSSAIRAAALRHALLSYLFGAVILATTVNFVVSLSSSSS